MQKHNLKFIIVSVLALTTYANVNADAIISIDTISNFDKIRSSAFRNFNKIRDDAVRKYEDIRRKANIDFARKLTSKWVPTQLKFLKKPPIQPTPPPVIEDINTLPPPNPNPIIIDTIISLPNPLPQPQPIEPIIEIDEDKKDPELTVNLYGTSFRFRSPNMTGFKLHNLEKSALARNWQWLSDNHTNILIRDCLRERDEKALCDWAYLNLLQKVADELSGNNPNAAALLTGFLFTQSGYKMRFAIDSAKQLFICYNTPGIVYNSQFLTIEGERYIIFAAGRHVNRQFEICDLSFPGEKPLSLEIRQQMNLTYSPAELRKVTAHFHPEVQVEITPNKNLLDFYNSYPDGTITTDPYTKWAIYANTPASPEVNQDLYPKLRKLLSDKSELESVNILLHLAQSFPYGYDEEIWGHDRAFFMDESWYYPLSDCEDHAINFSRMVRDLIGLETALIYYPGHLAAAVSFSDNSTPGDYVTHEGRKYTICDPTIFYANVGRSMKGLSNEGVVIIPLK